MRSLQQNKSERKTTLRHSVLNSLIVSAFTQKPRSGANRLGGLVENLPLSTGIANSQVFCSEILGYTVYSFNKRLLKKFRGYDTLVVRGVSYSPSTRTKHHPSRV